jgi:hypothetical protein
LAVLSLCFCGLLAFWTLYVSAKARKNGPVDTSMNAAYTIPIITLVM